MNRNVTTDFYPSLNNPYYFVRKGIYFGIKKYASFLTGHIMDFGCGSKPYQSFFQYTKYTGVDFENPGHPHDNEQIDIFYDGKTIPLESDSIDSVLCSEVFEHIFNLTDILKEVNRVMKKDGAILITCPFVWKEHEEPHDYARYTLFALEDILIKSGFKKVVTDKSGNFIEVIFQMIVLFFYDKYYGKANRFWLTRKAFTFLFIFCPNLTGAFFGKLYKNERKLYLNNVIVFRKC
jgi:SAM-dependent methyltransferase